MGFFNKFFTQTKIDFLFLREIQSFLNTLFIFSIFL